MTITEFLLARIAEDEAAANAVDLLSSEMEIISTHHLPEFADYMLRWQPNAVRAECAAKRAIIEQYETYGAAAQGAVSVAYTMARVSQRVMDGALRALAAVYKDHPDYQEEWA